MKNGGAENFADELYGNIHLSNESRTIMQIYLSHRPKLKKQVEALKGNYDRGKRLVS